MLKYKQTIVNVELSALKMNLTDKLIRAGCVQLGSGLFSSVYANPNNPNIVLKVGRNVGQLKPCKNIWADGFLSWLRHSRNHLSIHVPIVYDVQLFTHDRFGSTGVAYVVTMERLESNATVDQTIVANAIDRKLGGRVKALSTKYQQLKHSKNTNTAKLAHALADTWVESGKDLHDGNWMIRRQAGKPVAVITDPAS